MWIRTLKNFPGLYIVNSHLKRLSRTLQVNSRSLSSVINEKEVEMTEHPAPSLREVVAKLNEFANISLAEKWDNVGLLIEPYTETSIKNILLTNDLTESVMQESIDKNINLIISYHPPIFSPLKRITKSTWKERIVAACLENRIAVFSPHTSWDVVCGGVTDWLANTFGNYVQPNGRYPLIPTSSKDNLFVTSVIGPSEALDEINKEPISETFLSRTKSGDKEIGTLICSKETVNNISQLKNITVGVVECMKNEKPQSGAGRLLQVSGLNISKCVELLKIKLNLPHVRLALANGKNQDSPISTIALVPGSGGSLLKEVTADLFVTGEMFHHDILEANHKGTSVILTNHSDSERGFLFQMELILKKSLDSNVNIIISSMDADPIKTV